MFFFLKSRPLFTLAVGFIVFSALAATPQSSLESAPTLLDRKAVIAAAKAVTTQAYPNADDVLVDDRIVRRYRPDGTALTWDDTYNKVLTEKGKDANQTLSFYYDTAYSTIVVQTLEIVRPDGTAKAVDIARNSREMIDQSQMGSNIYNPNNKILRVNLPGLEIGDIVHYVSFENMTKCRMPNTWSEYSVMEYTSPIRRFELEISAPPELPLKQIKLRDPVGKTVVAETVKTPDGRTLHRWVAKDVPQVFEEPKMPPLSSVAQRVLVSSIPDWQFISKWYWKLCEPRLAATTPGTRQKVADLTKGLTDPIEKAKALFFFVSREIRYMGVTTEKVSPGYEPHDVGVTFENRYGVCRDKAALLVAMARLAGLEAFPVLINVGPKKDGEVPQPYFNHAIVAVRLAGGEYLLMDPTDENTNRLLPSYLCDMSYLVATPEGDYLRTTPIVPSSENLMTIKTSGDISAAGDLTAASFLTFSGINDNIYRGHFARLKPEERSRFFEGLIKRVAPGARLVRLDIAPKDLLDAKETLSVKLEYAAPDILVRGQRDAMLPLPWMGDSIGMVNFILDDSLGLKKRKYPLRTEIACGVRETLELRLDKTFGDRILTPTYQTTKTDDFNLARSVRVENGFVSGASAFSLDAVEFSPARYLALKTLAKTIEYDQRKRLVLTPAAEEKLESPAPDVRVLSERTDLVLADKGRWTERWAFKREILTYRGKKNNSEIKMSYNPVWETVKIVRADTIAKDGSRRSLKPEELNEMDAGWVGGAPRYPAEKTLVASLPGVEIGSTIDVEVEKTFRDRPFFTALETFRGYDRIDRKTLSLSAPSDVPLKISRNALEKVKETRQDRDGRTIYVWETENQSPLRQEASTPPAWAYLPTVMISSGDWESYAAELATAFRKATEETPAVQAKAASLTRPEDAMEKKLIAIRDFVVRGIRSAGPGFTRLPLSTITPAAVTLSDGYGHDADRAIVLAALLKAAGFAPTFVLPASLPDLPAVFDAPWKTPYRPLFPTVLVRVDTPKGPVFLNDTDQYAALGTTGFDKRPALELPSGKLIKVRALSGKENQIDIRYRVAIDAAGDAAITRTREFRGENYADRNKMFAEMPPEERDRYFQREVADIAQSAEPTGPLVTDFKNYPGREEISVKVGRYAVLDRRFLYFNAPFNPGAYFNLASDRRFSPLYQDGVIRATSRVTLTFPAGFTSVAIAPAAASLSVPAGRGDVILGSRSDEKNGGWVLSADVQLKPTVLPASDYPRLLEINRRLSHSSANAFLLEKP